jgi:hypothetical protein
MNGTAPAYSSQSRPIMDGDAFSSFRSIPTAPETDLFDSSAAYPVPFPLAEAPRAALAPPREVLRTDMPNTGRADPDLCVVVSDPQKVDRGGMAAVPGAFPGKLTVPWK